MLEGLFDQLGLTSFAKTSGSKGLQVYVPLNTPATYALWPLIGAARAVFLADGREVLANSFEGLGRTPLKIREASTGRELRTLPLTHGQHVRLSPDGSWLLVGVSMEETVLRRALTRTESL